MIRSLATLSLASSLALAAPFGEQISPSGITHSFLLTGNRTILVDEASEITWDAGTNSRDGEVLANGHLLIAFAKEVKEYDNERKVTFHYKLAAPNSEISTAQRLPNGNTLITELGAKPRLLEIAPDGTIAVECPLQPETDNTHMQTRMARKLPNGNYLVPHLLAFAIKEYTPAGKVVRTIKTDLDDLGGREKENWPFTAILLENDHILVNLTHGDKTVLFDRDGKIVRIASNETAKNSFGDPCGGQFLDNGNWIICSYGSRNDSMPDVFELSPKNEVVWQYKVPGFKGAHEIHILTTNGKPATGRR